MTPSALGINMDRLTGWRTVALRQPVPAILFSLEIIEL
jgi:hypothetical protein